MFKELQFTLFFIRDFITQNGLLDIYQHLITAYQTLQTAPTDDVVVNIDSIRQNLIDIHSRINYSAWSSPKISILNRLDATDLIGPSALSRINEIVIKNSGNSTAIIQKMTELRTETNNLLSKVDNLLKLLKLQEPIEPLKEGRQTLEVSFEGDAILKNFWEMEDRAKEWKFIIRAFTRLTGESFDSVKISAINSGSPEAGTILDMFIKTANAIVAGSKAAAVLIKMKDKFLAKKKTAENLGITNKDTFKLMMKDIEVQYDTERKAKISEMTMEITREHAVKKADSNDKNEISNMIAIALEKLSDIIGDGVRVIDPTEIKPSGEIETPDNTVSKLYSEIKALEKDPDVKLLLEAESKEKLAKRKAVMEKEIEEKSENKVSVKRGRPKKEDQSPNKNTSEPQE